MTISVERKELPRPQADKDYPRSYGEFLAWFPDDDACLDYLDWLRWPNGFSCPRCGGETAWRLNDGRWWCAGCRRRISATAGTIYHRTQTPLTLWFAAAWYMTSSKNGVSAKTRHRLLGFGSYQTVWAMLHRSRNAMVRPGRDRLCGDVEVDETMIGGVKPGKRGRGAHGKVFVAVAVEQIRPKGFGRCRLKVIPDAQSTTLRFLSAAPTSGRDFPHILQGACSQPQAESGKQAHTAEGKAHSSAVAASGGPASSMALDITALVWIPPFRNDVRLAQVHGAPVVARAGERRTVQRHKPETVSEPGMLPLVTQTNLLGAGQGCLFEYAGIDSLDAPAQAVHGQQELESLRLPQGLEIDLMLVLETDPPCGHRLRPLAATARTAPRPGARASAVTPCAACAGAASARHAPLWLRQIPR